MKNLAVLLQKEELGKRNAFLRSCAGARPEAPSEEGAGTALPWLREFRRSSSFAQRFRLIRKSCVLTPSVFACGESTSLQEGGFGTEAFPSCLGAWMMRLAVAWLNQYHSKNNKAPSVQGKTACAGGAFLHVFGQKKNTRHPGRTIAQPPSCVFGRKEKKRKESEWNELFFSFTCLSLMVQIIACV